MGTVIGGKMMCVLAMMMMVYVLPMMIAMVMMPVSGLRRDRSGQKNGGRYE